ncbi:hypothetical protein VTO42DRAFT_3304 [Malbranchea cinnamomea]
MAGNFAAVNVSDGVKADTPSKAVADVSVAEEDVQLNQESVSNHDGNRPGAGDAATSQQDGSVAEASQSQAASTPAALPSEQLPGHNSSSSISQTSHSSSTAPVDSARADGDSRSGPTRSLPSRILTDNNIDDAYVQFILYCNPGVPLTVDTGELRRAFRSIPRTDGKSFSIFALWLLVQKLYRGELKSWTHLIRELGVEPPSEGQSTQKLAQYVTRLKRWMHAMHVDAFFSYCFGREHEYYTEIPSPNDSDAGVRDGVPQDEDLALKSLFPESRNKRGRKPAFERLEDPEHQDKRTRLDPNGNFSSGSSSGQIRSATSPLPITPAPPRAQETHSRPLTQSSNLMSSFRLPQQSPQFQYPHSAITPRPRDSDSYQVNEPRSAVVPMSHGPIPNGSQRRFIPISPWPSPSPMQPTGHISSNAQANQNNSSGHDPNRSGGPFGSERSAAAGSKPLLSLQVPQSSVASVPLATPTVYVNDETRVNTVPGAAASVRLPGPDDFSQQSALAGVTMERVVQALRERIIGSSPANRQTLISHAEADLMANSMIAQLKAGCRLNMSTDVFAMYCALLLGVGSNVGLDGQSPIATTLEVSRNNLDDTSRNVQGTKYTVTYQFTLDDNAATAAGAIQTFSEGVPGAEHRSENGPEVLPLETDDSEDEPSGGPTSSGLDWKRRYMDLRKQVRKREAALQQYKKRVLEAVISDPLPL